MKYLISENKIDKIMYDYIVDLFENNNLGELNYKYNEDDYGNDLSDAIEFYFGDYGDSDNAFRWYSEEYFAESEREKCPIIEIETEYENALNSVFSDRWIEPFKNYIKNYYQLEVKTVQ
jgi:hypothetical protein